MKTFAWLIAFILFGPVFATAQQPAPSPPANPAPTPNTTQTQIQNSRPSRASTIVNMNSPSLFGAPVEMNPAARRQLIVQKYASPMYRKPTGKELKLLEPDSAIALRYAALLKRPDSGIFKLVPDAGCAQNSRVVNASELCLKHQFPGAGNSFSFRTENYRIRHLADLTYTSGAFYITGVFMHGLMVDLGDVPVENVTLQSPGVAFIVDFQPIDDFTKALEIDSQAIAGIRKDRYIYRRFLPVAADHTFVIRSIAYQGRITRSIKGAAYNELDFDKRKDVITAFRVVKADMDGTLTIVWTKLLTSPSPKLRVPTRDETNQLAAEHKSLYKPKTDSSP